MVDSACRPRVCTMMGRMPDIDGLAKADQPLLVGHNTGGMGKVGTHRSAFSSNDLAPIHSHTDRNSPPGQCVQKDASSKKKMAGSRPTLPPAQKCGFSSLRTCPV